MKALLQILSIAVLFYIIGFTDTANGQTYRTNKTDSWNEYRTWSIRQGANWNPLDQIGYNFNNNSGTTFNILLGDTIVLNSNETLNFTGNNVNFNIQGAFIVNGTMNFTQNNTNLSVNGNMIVNGTINIFGGGNSSISGDGSINVAEGGSFIWQGEEVEPNQFPNVIVGNSDDLCAPQNLTADVITQSVGYDIQLTWLYNYDDADCIGEFLHFEVSKDQSIISIIPGMLKSNLHSYTDTGLEAGDMPSYSVAAIYREGRSGTTSVSFNSPLPIELLLFDAKLQDNHVAVQWATAAEINNDYFTIERSNDGFNWEIIGYEQGAGNSNHVIRYNFTDMNPTEGVNYYRLKQTDFDGKFEYFAPAAVYFSSTSGTTEIVKTVARGQQLEVYLHNQDASAMLMITDLNGRMIYNSYAPVAEYLQQISIPLSRSYSGEILIVKLVSNTKSDATKLIVR